MLSVVPQPTIALPPFAVGIHDDVPSSEYHRREPGVASKSALDLLHQSPAHYYAWLRGEIDEETKALVFGSAFHCALLEPQKFARTYVTAPEFGDLRFKEAKEERNRWRASNAGKLELSATDMLAIDGMIKSVQAHRLGRLMIRDGKSEVTARWIDKETGVKCKCRADYFVPGLGMLLDAKSTQDASAEAFAKSCANYGYHRQDAFYRSGFAAAGAQVNHFVFLAVEKAPPYAVAIYELDDAGVAKGHVSIRRDLATFADCLKTNRFGGYAETITKLSLPRWAT